MKILFAPLNVFGSEQIGQRRGMHEVFGKENVVEWDYLHDSELPKGEFDLSWMQLQQNNLSLDILKDLQARVKFMTQFTGDIREVVPREFYQRKEYFDLTYIASKGQIPIYEKVCGKVKYMPIAVDPVEVIPTKQIPLSNSPKIVFIGNNYVGFPQSQERLDLCRVLTEHFPNFGVLGIGWPSSVRGFGACPVKEQGNWYSSAKIVICINNFNDVAGYWSERNLWCLASGTPMLMRRFPDIEEHFPPDTCIYFEDINDCIRKVKETLQNPSEWYEEMTRKARKLVLTKHNWSCRFKQLKEDYEQR